MLTKSELQEIHEILQRRAAELTGFRQEYTGAKVYYGSVELALTREIDRLNKLAGSVWYSGSLGDDETDE